MAQLRTAFRSVVVAVRLDDAAQLILIGLQATMEIASPSVGQPPDDDGSFKLGLCSQIWTISILEQVHVVLTLG